MEDTEQIKKYLLFALAHYSDPNVHLLPITPKVARLGQKEPYSPVCPHCKDPYLVWSEDPAGWNCLSCLKFMPDETTAERIVRYCNYWNEFKGSLEPQQRKAVEYRYIRQEAWHFVAWACRVKGESAEKYASEGIARVVEKIKSEIFKGPD